MDEFDSARLLSKVVTVDISRPLLASKHSSAKAAPEVKLSGSGQQRDGLRTLVDTIWPDVILPPCSTRAVGEGLHPVPGYAIEAEAAPHQWRLAKHSIGRDSPCSWGVGNDKLLIHARNPFSLCSLSPAKARSPTAMA
jgi:hypothetical protein